MKLASVPIVIVAASAVAGEAPKLEGNTAANYVVLLTDGARKKVEAFRGKPRLLSDCVGWRGGL